MTSRELLSIIIPYQDVKIKKLIFLQKLIRLDCPYQIFFVLMSKRNKEQDKASSESVTMNAKDFIDIQGEVEELMPAATFKVVLENGHEILAHLSGKMRMNKIRLLPGDRVKVQISPYDLSKGRIVYRM